jgi:hypothetical protein
LLLPKPPLRTPWSVNLKMPLEHGELMPKRQIFEPEQATRLAARKQGPEQNQDDIRHSESSFEQSSQEINDSDGLRGFSRSSPHLGPQLGNDSPSSGQRRCS